MSVVLVLRQGDEVKAGQVLGFIEQLGTFMPVEVSPCAEAMFCLSCNIASAICHRYRAWQAAKEQAKACFRKCKEDTKTGHAHRTYA